MKSYKGKFTPRMLYSTSCNMQITRIQQAQKNESRVNLFLNDEFWIGIDKDELLSFQLYKGKEIDEELKSQIEQSSSTTKLTNKVINYIQIRPRSEKEVRDYLKKKNVDPISTSQIISKLKSKDLISDEQFTRWYIENRLISGKFGELRIKNELMQKGIPKSLVDSTYKSLLTDEKESEVEEKALIYATKISKTIKSENKYEFRTKLIKKLMGRGYSYSLSSKIASKVENWSIQ